MNTSRNLMGIVCTICSLWLISCQPISPTSRSESVGPDRQGVEVSILPTMIESSGNWHLALPISDSTAPTLMMTEDERIYHLAPSFQVARIELASGWQGLGKRVEAYQHIERHNNQYWRGDQQVNQADIVAFLHSISNLRRESVMMFSFTHTDDYPYWELEISDEEGNHIQLRSGGNAPNHAPWHVLYNGEIYSQFSGEIAAAIDQLFAHIAERAAATTIYPAPSDELLHIQFRRDDTEPAYGMNGLLALQSTFTYKPDLDNNELAGEIWSSDALDGEGDMVLGTPKVIEQITLLDGSGDGNVDCLLTPEIVEQRNSPIWHFHCPFRNPINSTTYHYPIQIRFTTDQTQTYTTTGELWGYWQPSLILPAKRFPDELESILKSSPVAQDLLTDHEAIVTEFETTIDPVTSQFGRDFQGAIALLGQAQIGPDKVNYSILLPIEIKNREMSAWTLDREKLRTLLKEVAQFPLTQRFIKEDPNLVINLFYIDHLQESSFSDNLKAACADVPRMENLPTLQAPLVAFSFNQPPNSIQPQLMVFNHRLRVGTLAIEPALPRDKVWASLLPQIFKDIRFPVVSSISSWSWSQSVTVEWAQDTTAEQIENFKNFPLEEPASREYYELSTRLESTMLSVTEEGRLDLTVCHLPR